MRLLARWGGWILGGQQAAIALAVMMTLFFQAARLALIAFDPSSEELTPRGCGISLVTSRCSPRF
jgi:hypothetical protein